MSDDQERTLGLDQLWDQTLKTETDATLRTELEKVKADPEGICLPPALTAEDSNESEEFSVTAIGKLSIPEKIKLALYGNKTCRGILIKDRYRPIPHFVLQNPRLNEAEVLEFAKDTGVDQSVLRAIAAQAAWMKSYPLKLAIVSNPKLPIDISLRHVPFLQDKDLRHLARSKNVPNVLSVQCRKLLEQRGK